MNIKTYLTIGLMLGGSITAKAVIRINSLPSINISGQENSEKNRDLLKLRSLYRLPTPQAGEGEVSSALMSTKLLMLHRVDASTVTGANIWKSTLTLQQLRDISKTVRALAFAASQKQGGAMDLLNLYLDFLFSQQIFERIPKFNYNNYADVRKVPADFLSAITICDDTRKEKLITAVQQLLEIDIIRQGDEAIKNWISSDYLYNAIPHIFLCALYHPDNNKAIQYMELFSHFLSVCTQYTDGGHDILKPDGTGFHHNTHYNGYMYSYRTWVEYIARLKGTSFRIDKAAYTRLKKAVTSIYLMSTRSEADKNHYFANSMAGRHPFTGLDVKFSKSLFESLIEIGGDIEGKKYDIDLASYYNYFFKSTKYDISEKKLDGFYQFNYSPAGIYRKDNWVAVMRSPTTKFWGGEIYDKTNRFGRYQSHGTLEVMYEGGLSASGYPENEKTNAGGWDWNMAPGSTTVHYTDWKSMLPAQNEKERFDQYSLTTDFSGALAWKDCGLFGAAFDQDDKWGNKTRFTPTNLKYKKSVFCIDGLLFSMGNSISSRGNYPEDWITATNLFQSVISKKYTTLVVNGEEIKKGGNKNIETDKSAWILTPVGTGFYIPEGHDELKITYKKQKTPSSNGLSAPENELLVAKAYLDHGIKPENKSYCFLEVPATNATKMKEISDSQKMNKLFKVIAFNSNFHIVEYLPLKTIAYTFFTGAENVAGGIIYGSSSEALIMEKMIDGTLSLALCNPNLHPTTVKGRLWKATPTTCTLRLKGKWCLKEDAKDVSLTLTTDGNTELRTILSQGEPIYISLISIKK